ncbi:hydrolase [Mesobacillus foraminis]|uniref:hydrolase n=1 Tax=Mesobacillus foraminis TaxID=279826 RepID=UPI0039A0100B
MENRNFRLDTQWNMIHYPDRPNGFGILILGDERHFVDKETSFWTQNEGKRTLLNDLKKAGYTIFYSNLYGLHWGSQKAVELAQSLCAYIKRNEILNEKIHVLAEGMGALVALKLIQTDTKIRSLLLINPILSLKSHLQQEREHKFFYKKLLKEMSFSFNMHPEDIEALVENNNGYEIPELDNGIPVEIIHVLAGSRAYRQSALINQYCLKWKEEGLPVSLLYMVPEKKPQMGDKAVRFFKKQEAVL